MPPTLADGGRRRDALSIDALVDTPARPSDHIPSPPRTRQCGKCQEAHSRCDGRDPCRNCEVRGTLCGYAWTSFSAPTINLPPVVPAAQPRPAPGYSQHVLYFPPPSKRHNGRSPEHPLRGAHTDGGGWAIVPVGTNAPAVTRGGEPGPPIQPCKTCQARNTTCDGVTPVCGSCRTRRLECYIAAPAATTATTAIPLAERQRVQSMKNKQPQQRFQPPQPLSPPVPARNRAMSANEDGKPSRASLSFMLNPTADAPVASSSRAPVRLAELGSPFTRQPLPSTPLITPPTPIAPNSMEQMQAQSRMDLDSVSPRLEPRPTSPLSPSSSGASLSRRTSRKRSASPSSYDERWSSPSRESAGSAGLKDRDARRSIDSYSTRPSIDSYSTRPSLDSRPAVDSRTHSARASMDSHSTRLSIDSHVHSPRHSIDSPFPLQPPDSAEERAKSKSSLSHLLDGGGMGGISPVTPAAPITRPTSSISAPGRPTSSASTASTTSRPTSKRASISTTMSTALSGMQLKSATTSRASSPGGTMGGRERAHAWPTFGAVGETIGGSGVWRNETEVDMKRKEVEAEGRRKEREAARRDVEMEGPVVEAKRDEGPKRRKLEDAEGDEPSERRMSIVEDTRMSIVEQLRRASEPRRGSIPMPGSWVIESEPPANAAIVVNDSPELQSNDMVIEADEPKEPLISAPTASVVSSKSPTPVSAPQPTRTSSDSRNGSTPPAVQTAFQHIWPPPAFPLPDSSKKSRKKHESAEPASSRSFITKLNIAPAGTLNPPEEDVKDKEAVASKEREKETVSSQPSALRSMLTTMPPRAVFTGALQKFLTEPLRRGRAVVMTKTLMKDALGVLLDPNSDELLKDYVPPDLKEDEKLGKDRDGTPARGRKQSIAIDSNDHTSLEFRAWAKRMFSTVKTSRGEDVLAFGGKPVVIEDDIYETIVVCHQAGNHCSAKETARLVDEAHSWVPRVLVEAFVQECPGCPASNKVTSVGAKPKKRKWVRKEDKAGAGAKRRPATRRTKKSQDGEQTTAARRGRKGKEASPAEDSDQDLENEGEDDELKESGDEAREADVKDETEEAEEEEMESEDDHASAAAPSTRPVVTASEVPDLERMDESK